MVEMFAPVEEPGLVLVLVLVLSTRPGPCVHTGQLHIRCSVQTLG